MDTLKRVPSKVRCEVMLSEDLVRWRSGILGSAEITKTNEVNLHGFCADAFLILLKLGLRVYLWKK